jgi:hypothetical protein
MADENLRARNPLLDDSSGAIDPNASPTWGDWGNTVVGGAYDVATQARSLSRTFNEATGDTDAAEIDAINQRQNRRAADEARERLSPVAKQRLEADVLSGDFWSAPGSAAAMKLMGAAPFFAAALPTSIVAGLLGPVSGIAGAAAIGGAMNAGQLTEQVDRMLDEASDEKLAQDSDLFAGMLQRMPPEQARREYKDWLLNGDGKLALTTLLGAAGGVLGPVGMAGRAASGEAAAVASQGLGRLGSAGMGMAEGLASGALTGAGSAYAGQEARIDAGQQDEFDPRQFASELFENMGFDVAVGGAMGGVFHGGKDASKKPTATPRVETVEANAPDAAQAEALAATTAPTEPVATEPTPGEKREPVVEPAQAEALKQTTEPTEVTPEVKPEQAPTPADVEALEAFRRLTEGQPEGAEPAAPAPHPEIPASDVEALEAFRRLTEGQPEAPAAAAPAETAPARPDIPASDVEALEAFRRLTEGQPETVDAPEAAMARPPETPVAEEHPMPGNAGSEASGAPPVVEAPQVTPITAQPSPADVIKAVKEKAGERAETLQSLRQEYTQRAEKAKTLQREVGEKLAAQTTIKSTLDKPATSQIDLSLMDDTLRASAERRRARAAARILDEVARKGQTITRPELERRLDEHASSLTARVNARRAERTGSKNTGPKIIHTEDIATPAAVKAERAAQEAQRAAEAAKADAKAAHGQRGKFVEDASNEVQRRVFARRLAKFTEGNPEGDTVFHKAAAAMTELKALGRKKSPAREGLLATIGEAMAAERTAGTPIAVVKGAGGGKAAQLKARRKAERAERAEHYKPGEVVRTDSGLDRVLAYSEGKDGRFTVTVQDIDPATGELKKGSFPRTHSTDASKRNIADTKKLRAAVAKVTEEQRAEAARQAEIARLAEEQKEDAKTDKTGRDVRAKGGTGKEIADKGEPAALDDDSTVLHEEVDADALERGHDTLEAADKGEDARAIKDLEEFAPTADDAGPIEAETYQDAPVRERPKPVVTEAHFTAAKADMRQVVVVKPKRRAVAGRRFLEDDDVVIRDPETGAEARPLQSGSVASMLDRADFSHLDGVAAKLVPFFHARLIKAVGHVPVHVVSAKDMMRLTGRDKAPAGYIVGEGKNVHVVILDKWAADPAKRLHVVMHEALHGVLHEKIEGDFATKMTIELMMRDTDAYFRANNPELVEHYGFTNAHEFVSEAFSNPNFQNALAHVPVSKELAQSVGLGQARPLNAWDALVAMVRRIVGLPSGQFSVLQGLIRVAHENWGEGRIEPSLASRPMLQKREVTRWVNDRGAQDLYAKGRWVRRATDTLTMLGQRGAQFADQRFGEITRSIAELAQRQDVTRTKLLEQAGGFLDMARDMAALQRTHGAAKYAEAADVLFDASEANVNLGPGAKNDFGKDKTRWWQPAKRLGALQRRFAQLHPDLQDHIVKVSALLKAEQDAKVRDTIDKTLAAVGIADKGLAGRIFDQKLTEADYKRFGTDKIVAHLARVSADLKKEGMYAPFMRHGDYVVNAKAKVDMPKGAMAVPGKDGTIRFTPTGNMAELRRTVKAYVKGADLPVLKVRKVWVDETNPAVSTRPDGTPLQDTDAGTALAYEVDLQNRHTSFHESLTEATRAAETLGRQGLEASTVDLRRDLNADGFTGLMPSQFEAMVTSLKGDSRFSKLGAAQQNLLTQTLHEVGARFLPGPRIQKHALERQNVAGYSRDLTRAVAEYGTMSAAYRAKLQFAPKIQEALTEGERLISARSDKDATKVRMREILQEMETRVLKGAGVERPTRVGRAVSRLVQLSMLDKLAGVSYHVINAQEPWTTSLPVLGGRHGFGRTAMALKNAYSLIGAGSALRSGLSDTAVAFRQDTGFTDYHKTFKEVIAQSSKGERAIRLGQLLDHLYDTNLMGHEAGMEVQRLGVPSTNAAGRVLDRADLMARQVGSAIEAINRAVTGIAAYEMEFKRNGGNHEGALQYAHDAVHDTMGNYAASNASPMFNSPVGKVALQFKKFAQKTYYLLGKTVGAAIRGDREAQRQFIGLMFTHAVVAGVLGLPLEPIKIALIAANVLGATTFTYDDFEQLVRAATAGALGKTGGEIVSRGWTRAIGIDTSSRQGINSLLTMGAPRSDKANDLKSFLFDTMAGAPAGLVLQEAAGIKALLAGDLGTAADKLIPLKAARDINRAVTGAMGPKLDKNGRPVMDTLNPAEALAQGIGFTPAKKAEGFEMQEAYRGDQAKLNGDRRALTNKWVTADPTKKKAIWLEIEAWNRRQPKDARITMKDLTSAKGRRDTEAKTGSMQGNMRVGRREKELFAASDSVYNWR